MEKYPETRPRNTKKAAASFVAERAAERRAEQVAAAVPRSLALTPDEVDTQLELSPTEIAQLEDERRQIQEALHIPKPTPEPVSGVAAPPKSRRPAVAPEEVEDVSARLKSATDLVIEHERKIAAAEEAARLAAEKRGHELEAARQALGRVESEKNRLEQQRVVGNLAEVTALIQQGEVENDARTGSSAVERRKDWQARAEPLLRKIFAFETELKAFLAENKRTLETLANLTWEKVSERYRIQDRTAIVDRSRGPAREILGNISNTLRAIEEVAGLAEMIIDGKREPSDTVMHRIVNYSKHSIGNYREQLAVLSTSVAMITDRAVAYEKKHGQPVPEVRTVQRLPKPEGSDAAPIQTAWDPQS